MGRFLAAVASLDRFLSFLIRLACATSALLLTGALVLALLSTALGMAIVPPRIMMISVCVIAGLVISLCWEDEAADFERFRNQSSDL